MYWPSIGFGNKQPVESATVRNMPGDAAKDTSMGTEMKLKGKNVKMEDFIPEDLPDGKNGLA